MEVSLYDLLRRHLPAGLVDLVMAVWHAGLIAATLLCAIEFANAEFRCARF
jgi:hypothetical protein